MSTRITLPTLRAPIMPIYPAVLEGLQGLWLFGGTMDRSKRNHWYGGAGDLVVPAGAPEVHDGFCRIVDGASFFETNIYDSGSIGICIIARSVSDTQASLVSTSQSSVLGDYGFNFYIQSGTVIRYRRDCNNAGSMLSSQPQIKTRDVSEWTAYWAGNDASLAYLQCLTPAQNVQVSIYGTPTVAPRGIRVGSDYYASGTTGSTDIAALAIYRRWPSSSERTSIAAQLMAQAADAGIFPA